MAEDNGRYRAGQVDAKLDSIAADVAEIKKLVREFVEWQVQVEARLATGAEKFRTLEGRDRTGGVVASIVGILAAVMAAVVAELRR